MAVILRQMMMAHETLPQKKKKHFTKKGWWSGSRCRPGVQTLATQKMKTIQMLTKLQCEDKM
jgi:hypothetical protein